VFYSILFTDLASTLCFNKPTYLLTFLLTYLLTYYLLLVLPASFPAFLYPLFIRNNVHISVLCVHVLFLKFYAKINNNRIRLPLNISL